MFSKKVIEIFRKNLNLKHEKISLDSQLIDLGMDSLDKISIIMELEETFNMHIKDEDIKKFNTVNDVIQNIRLRNKDV